MTAKAYPPVPLRPGWRADRIGPAKSALPGPCGKRKPCSSGPAHLRERARVVLIHEERKMEFFGRGFVECDETIFGVEHFSKSRVYQPQQRIQVVRDADRVNDLRGDLAISSERLRSVMSSAVPSWLTILPLDIADCPTFIETQIMLPSFRSI